MTWDSIGTAAAIGTPFLALIVGWIRWSIRTAVRDVVNGKVDRVREGVERIEQQMAAHDRRHGHEQRQLMAALDRQGVAAPDGWSRGESDS